MEIKYTKHVQASKVNPKGEMHYFLIGLDNPTDYEIVKSVLIDELSATMLEDINAIWLRRAVFILQGHKFMLYWDEDFGVMFIDHDHSERINERLDHFIKEAIPKIKARIEAKNQQNKIG
jgi:hypothetical protein